MTEYTTHRTGEVSVYVNGEFVAKRDTLSEAQRFAYRFHVQGTLLAAAGEARQHSRK